ncbi:olfactory receptor family 51 subfamily S member 1 [Rhinolophus ferrumequinum]|uniref:Olfactory receptor family 51 subfamily S member 1 n=1 Tax=Rhinolophus ferrumequinum TaxID=59479 RepID=B2KHX6_RHIFE|nr:olfactory receptor 51S1 [Rhinolophus ferrumequinum]ACC62051.1 olfactory receptor, family 51, subfamily S, member 1 (predicted) [Rhinolophus ferrumequinum]KAF6333803.1 olfactory receptor family 51 subfamily S member 1 [Rhinolophus ferrumequinum]
MSTFLTQASPNSSTSMAPTFLLVGLPGLSAVPSWWTILLITVYSLSVLGNGTILWVLALEPTLHRPMYFFLSLLSVSDVGLATALMPTLLGLALADAHAVPASACLLQMFFVHVFSIMESSVLLTMALDRTLAICRPLHYPALLTNDVISKISLAIVFRSLGLHLPLPFLLAHMPYCHPQVLTHSYCLHPDMTRLACPGAWGAVYSLFVVLSAMVLDPLVIFFSYGLIGRVLRGLGSSENRWKAGQTCAAHLSAVLFFYVPMILLALIDHLKVPIPQPAHTLLSYVHFLLPPLINPILYSVKMKEIRERILKRLQPRKVGCAQ